MSLELEGIMQPSRTEDSASVASLVRYFSDSFRKEVMEAVVEQITSIIGDKFSNPTFTVNVPPPNVTIYPTVEAAPPPIVEVQNEVNMSQMVDRLAAIESLMRQLLIVLSKNVVKTVDRDENRLIVSVTERKT